VGLLGSEFFQFRIQYPQPGPAISNITKSQITKLQLPVQSTAPTSSTVLHPSKDAPGRVAKPLFLISADTIRTRGACSLRSKGREWQYLHNQRHSGRSIQERNLTTFPYNFNLVNCTSSTQRCPRMAFPAGIRTIRTLTSLASALVAKCPATSRQPLFAAPTTPVAREVTVSLDDPSLKVAVPIMDPNQFIAVFDDIRFAGAPRPQWLSARLCVDGKQTSTV
jgi:hypothetical protein